MRVKRTSATALAVVSLAVAASAVPAEATTILGPSNVAGISVDPQPLNTGSNYDGDVLTDYLVAINFWQNTQHHPVCNGGGVTFRLADLRAAPNAPNGVWATSQHSTCQIWFDRDYWNAYKTGVLYGTDWQANRWQWNFCNTVVHEMGHLAGMLHPTSEANLQTWIMGYGDNVGVPPRATDCYRWTYGNSRYPVGN